MLITGPEATLIACVIAAIIALYIRWRTAFGAASKAFVEAFASDIAAIEKGNMRYVHQFLLASFDRHTIAVGIFRRHLPRFRRTAFDKAWEQYQGGKEYELAANRVSLSAKERILMPYSAQSTEDDNRQLAIANLHALLRFAQP